MSKKIPKHIFRAYDIRGIYKKDIDCYTFYKIGLSTGTYVKKQMNGTNIALGNDIRNSSIPLAYSFISGLTASGINVSYTGTTSFGQTLYKGWELKKNLIAFITASHLPPEWNGIKFYYSDGVGFPEEKLRRIRDITLNKEYMLEEWDKIGKVERINPESSYTNYFKNNFNYKNNMKVAVDCGGASMTLSAPKIFRTLGINLISVYCKPDPSFSKRPSDPKPKNLTKLKKTVTEKNCAFGVGFDGDGDRSVIVDDTGKILTSDETGIIIAKHGLEKKEGTIVANVECSKAIDEQLKPLGYKIKRIPVGHTFLTLHAKKEKAPLGIESSGHIILPEYFLFDDALIVPLKIAEILDNKKQSLSNLLKEIPSYPITKLEVKCSEEKKFKTIEKLIEKLKIEYQEVNTLDGIRIKLDKGWVLIRASNTSPLIRITSEADTKKIADEIAEEFRKKTEKMI
ncbi:MAG: hypothetical protein V5A68_01765 [Candidatus Thermoplasmatota archaeon]